VKRATSSSGVAALIATVLGNGALVFASLLCSLFILLVAWLPSGGRWSLVLQRLWARILLRASGVRLERIYAEELPPDGRFVFLANHQSLYDIPALLESVPVDFRFLAKRALFKIPIFGWALAAAGTVAVDRKDRSHAQETFAAAVDRLRSGVSIVIFPEETRSLDGAIGPFRSGGLLLALKSGLPVVPVGIRGSLAVQPKGSFWVKPGKVVVSFGIPIASGQYSVREKRKMADDLRRRIGRLAAAPLQ